MKLELTDLRLFAEIADAGNLTRGAQRCFLTAPAASARVKALEQSLGAALLYRGNKGVSLTEAGERLLHHARVILRQVDYLRDDFSDTGRIGGHIRVYANTTAVTEFLPEILASFLSERPRATVDVQERLTHDILRAVRDGSADLGIVSGDVSLDGVEAIPFSTDRLMLAVSDTHPLASRKRVDFNETLAFEHIGLHEGSTLMAFLQSLFDKSGYDRLVRIQVRSFEAMCRLIESGVGIGVVPESAARRHAVTMNLRLLEIADTWSVRTRYVVVRTRDALPRMAEALVRELVRTGAGGVSGPKA